MERMLRLSACVQGRSTADILRLRKGAAVMDRSEDRCEVDDLSQQLLCNPVPISKSAIAGFWFSREVYILSRYKGK
jgi:hypothetical protein